MTRTSQVTLARMGAAIAGAIVLACTAVMWADYAVARSRVPRDDARLAELQAQARADAAASLALEAEQNHITSARLARRARTGTLAIVLIAASAAFIGCAKWRVALGPRRPAAPPGPMHKAIKLRKLQDALVRYRVTDACTGCTLCAQVCKTGAIAYRPYEKHDIDDSRCTWCDKCFQACLEGAVEVVSAANGAPAPRPTRPRPLAS